MADTVSKSWFITFNNPAEHGYSGSPEEVCNRLKDEWIKDSETRSGAWAYCISEKGLHHVHCVVEDVKAMRFTAVKKSYAVGCHLEETKGNKKQALDYIHKRGVFAEKGETIEFICYHGDIQGKQGSRSDLADIYKRLESGETPSDILADSPKTYCHIDVIKKMYYDIRSKNTPIIRPLKVIWHVGKTGTGKSYERVLLSELYGEDNIFYLTAFNNGSFDSYNGQKILWIEDFRGEFKLQELLRILDVYKAEVPARYTNIKALWDEVHITSVLTPNQVYKQACIDDYDRIEQLLRRITSICYHFKDKNNNYYKLYFSPFMTLNDMQNEANKHLDMINNYVPVPVQIGDDVYYSIEDLWRVEGEPPVGLPSAAQGET